MAKRNFLTKNILWIATILTIVGFVIIIAFIFINPFNDWSFNCSSELFSQYGSFIGGFVGPIFSLVAILLLYRTLIEQQKITSIQNFSIESQKNAFDTELFETTFFNLLRTQQELTNNLKAYIYFRDNDFKVTKKTVLDREFFGYSKVELTKIFKAFKTKRYLGKFDGSEESIHYLLVMIDEIHNPEMQVHPDDALEIEDSIRENERIRYTNSRYEIAENIWNSAQTKDPVELMSLSYSLFFQKYHYAIGHYFRHLYHIIKFAKEFSTTSKSNTDLNKRYVDFIQAQMSSYELMLLFYNAVSFPKLMNLLIQFNFLENLSEEDLIEPQHNCITGIKLKKRRNLIKIE